MEASEENSIEGNEKEWTIFGGFFYDHYNNILISVRENAIKRGSINKLIKKHQSECWRLPIYLIDNWGFRSKAKECRHYKSNGNSDESAEEGDYACCVWSLAKLNHND